MRISDWSSDVCSSDLGIRRARGCDRVARRADAAEALRTAAGRSRPRHLARVDRPGGGPRALERALCPTRDPDRQSVVSGKSVSVRLAFGGRPILNKNKTAETPPNMQT